MANAICVHTTLQADDLRIPELLPFLGKRVQIIVVEDEPVIAETTPRRTLGSMRGALRVPEGFDEPLPDEVLRALEGEAGG